MENKSYFCPECGSDDIEAVSVAYRKGQSNGMGTNATMISDFAKEIAPPTAPVLRKSDNDSLGVLGYSVLGIGGICAGISFLSERIFLYLLIVVSSLSVIYVIERINKKRINAENKKYYEQYVQEMKYYNDKMNEWNHLFVCNRCGEIFRL